MNFAEQTASPASIDSIHLISGFRVQLLPASPYCVTYTTETPTLGFAYDSQSGYHAIACDRQTPFTAIPNGLSFLPVDCDVYSQSAKGGEYLHIALAAETANTTLPDFDFRDQPDPIATQIALNIRRLLLKPDVDNLHLENLCHDLLQTVITHKKEPDHTKRCITRRRLNQLDHYIEAHLDQSLSVKGLANQLGLSAGFLSRAMKKELGQSPYDYIIDRRIARARSLLKNSRDTLATIAVKSGFSSHSHMTDTFKTRLGINPNTLKNL